MPTPRAAENSVLLVILGGAVIERCGNCTVLIGLLAPEGCAAVESHRKAIVSTLLWASPLDGHGCSCGGLIESLAQQGATIAVELVGPGLGKRLRQRVTLLQRFVRPIHAPFNPVKRAVGPPIIHIKASGLFGFHPRPPLARSRSIAPHVSVAEDKHPAQIRWNTT